MNTSDNRWGPGLLMLGFAVVVLVALCWFVLPNKQVATVSALPKDVGLPLLAISGVIVLLIVLALVAGAFSIFSLSDRTQALGLPEGSVRAVIALSLVVLFAILTIYLYTEMTHGHLEQVQDLNEQQKNDLLKIIPSAKLVSALSNGSKDAAERFTVIYRDGNSASDDFAKQLLVMIGTLVTSVSSFYFGAKTAITAASAGATAGGSPPKSTPIIRRVTPAQQARGAAFDLEITGDNLDLIKEAKLVQGSSQVVASDLTSNASLVKCTVTVPAADPAGAWDVSVNDGAGQQAKLPAAITMT